MDLPDVISAICVKVLGSVPRHDRAVHLSVSSCSTSVSPKGQEDRLVKYSHKQLRVGLRFRGCNHSLIFKLLYLLGLLTVLTKGLKVPLGQKAVYTGLNPTRYRDRAPALLRVRIRTIDTTGLAEANCLHAPARSQPCRRLLTLAKARSTPTHLAMLSADASMSTNG